MTLSYPTDMSDAQWDLSLPLLPAAKAGDRPLHVVTSLRSALPSRRESHIYPSKIKLRPRVVLGNRPIVMVSPAVRSALLFRRASPLLKRSFPVQNLPLSKSGIA